MKKCIGMLLAALLLVTALMPALAEDTSLDKILQKGELVLGLDDSFPPMGYRDENNEIVGFDIDLAREVCVRLGVELKLQPIDWAAKEMELNSGNIDCIWNGMSSTPERQESMACSMDYLNNKIVFLAKDPAIKGREDLVGKRVAVQSGSYAEEVLEQDAQYADFYKSLDEVLAYPDYLTAIMDMQNGNVEAVLIDLVVANYQMTQIGDDSLFTVDNLSDDLYCVGFRKDDVSLRDKVNEIFKEMAKDGKLDEISAKWFGENITLIAAE
ncbi:MAG TPA: amino acid ABC transporter substrate-binding protein [Clostridia bacterium]|nr:amino acid ABC transporter substrate-binding protein [Clostridia bacterium]